MSLESLGRTGMLATLLPVDDPPEYARRSLGTLLDRGSTIDPPAEGGSAIVRDMTGSFFVGDDFARARGAISICLFGSRVVRRFTSGDVFSCAPLGSHTRDEARIIGDRQRRGEPALVAPITPKQRAVRRRWDAGNGRHHGIF